MSEKKHIQWLLNELPRLRERELISAETETALRHYYSEQLGVSRNYFMLALGILGLALVAAGIVLIFNYNWDMLQRPQQIGVSFLPLLLGLTISVYTLLRSKTQLWREASAILTAAGGAVAVALLSQIYQINGSLSEYMTLVLLTSLPLIFIFDSIGLATLYAFGMFPLMNDRTGPNGIQFAIFCGILIYLLWHLRPAGACRIYARYLLLPVMVFMCLLYAAHGPALMLFTLAGFFLLLACDRADEDPSFWKNPWFPAAFVLLTVLLAIGMEAKGIFRSAGTDSLPKIVWFWIVEGALLAGTGAVIVRNFRKKKRDVFRVMIPILLLLVMAGYLIQVGKWESYELFFRVGINCFTGAFGISLLCAGFRNGSLLVFNEGMLLCAVLFIVRFLSADIGLVARGIGMIAAGLLIIGANLYLSRRIRSGKEVCHETK